MVVSRNIGLGNENDINFYFKSGLSGSDSYMHSELDMSYQRLFGVIGGLTPILNWAIRPCVRGKPSSPGGASSGEQGYLRKREDLLGMIIGLCEL